MSSLMNGICGATLTPTGMPASASVRMVRRRRCGAAARGSSRRVSFASSEVMVTYTAARPCAAMGASRSMSRSTPLPLVTMASGWRVSLSTCSTPRMRRSSRSTGW